eukprot:tig00000492_g1424.t1
MATGTAPKPAVAVPAMSTRSAAMPTSSTVTRSRDMRDGPRRRATTRGLHSSAATHVCAVEFDPASSLLVVSGVEAVDARSCLVARYDGIGAQSRGRGPALLPRPAALRREERWQNDAQGGGGAGVAEETIAAGLSELIDRIARKRQLGRARVAHDLEVLRSAAAEAASAADRRRRSVRWFGAPPPRPLQRVLAHHGIATTLIP